MKRQSNHHGAPAILALFVGLALAASTLIAPAYTTVQFQNVQAQITNDIATLSATPDLSRQDRALLRSLNRANDVFAKPSLSDGKVLRRLNSIVGRNPEYVPSLTAVASNLLASFKNEYEFVGSLLIELPPTPQAPLVIAQYNALAPFVEKLKGATNLTKFAALCDATKARLDIVFAEVNRALLVPFPLDISENAVAGKINGINFRASATSASENTSGFSAVATPTNIVIVLRAANFAHRGIYLSIPNAQPGTIRYPIGTTATFAFRTDIDFFNGTETQTAATNGAIFLIATDDKVYGSFTASGPGFDVTEGRFRIALTQSE